MAPVVSSLKALCFAYLSANAAATFYVGNNYDAAGCAASALVYSDVGDFAAFMGTRCLFIGAGLYRGWLCENETIFYQDYTDDKCTTKTGNKTEQKVSCDERRSANGTVKVWGTSECKAADPRPALGSMTITYETFTDATCSGGGAGQQTATMETGCRDKTDWDDDLEEIVVKSVSTVFSNNQLTETAYTGVQDCSGTGGTPEVKFKCGCNDMGDGASSMVICPDMSKADVGGEVSTETEKTNTTKPTTEAASETVQGGEEGDNSTETGTTPKSGEGGEGSAKTETTETATTTKAVVSFTTKLVGGKPNEFDESKYISSVASASGVDTSSVEVESVSFVTTAQYKFLEDVTTDEIETAVAGALGLNKINVEATLVSGRRLEAARRLAVTADVKVATASAADATTLAESLKDTETLATQLSQATGKKIGAPEVTSLPVLTVEVVTRIKSDTGEPPKTPEASELTDAMPGAEVAVDINVNENVDANVEVETSTTTVERDDAANHAASMQGPMLALLCAFAMLLRTV